MAKIKAAIPEIVGAINRNNNNRLDEGPIINRMTTTTCRNEEKKQ